MTNSLACRSEKGKLIELVEGFQEELKSDEITKDDAVSQLLDAHRKRSGLTTVRNRTKSFLILKSSLYVFLASLSARTDAGSTF